MSSGYISQAKDTVKVKSDLYDSGFVIINAEDFDEEAGHELYVEEGEDVSAAEAVVAPKRKRR